MLPITCLTRPINFPETWPIRGGPGFPARKQAFGHVCPLPSSFGIAIRERIYRSLEAGDVNYRAADPDILPFATMFNFNVPLCVLLAGLGVSVSASPQGARVAAPDPPITPPPTLVELSPTRTYNVRRNLFSDLQSGVHSALSALGSNIPSFVASGK